VLWSVLLAGESLSSSVPILESVRLFHQIRSDGYGKLLMTGCVNDSRYAGQAVFFSTGTESKGQMAYVSDW
jgi:hypothetical protein